MDPATLPDGTSGQEAEEGTSENEDELEDIFEIEGMSELDINATPEELERRRKQQQDRGGWEGTRVNAAASTSGRPAVDETADKLDSLMELMFAHLGRRHESGAASRRHALAAANKTFVGNRVHG